MGYKKYFIPIFLILSFFWGTTVLAAGFLILEIQTTGTGGAYDEFVKIQNNTGQTINLTGYKLQSQGASGGNWVNRTGTDGLPSLTISPAQIFIIASKDYTGADEIYRHSARWGFSDAGGGVRFLDANGNILAEEHWSESAGLVVFHQPISNTSVVENSSPETSLNNSQTLPPSSEPPSSEDKISESDAASLEKNNVISEEQTPISTVTSSKIEDSRSTQKTDKISEPPSVVQNNNTAQISLNNQQINQINNGKDLVNNKDLVKVAKADEGKEVISNKVITQEQDLSIPAAKKLKIGSSVKVRGIVSVPPGVLGEQIFYLAGSGIQVYMHSKDFPNLRVGDLIEIKGELSEAYGEKRIKLANKDSIKFISSAAPPIPHQSSVKEINEDLEGSLVTLTGEIIEIKNNLWFLGDGDKEIKISIKTGTNIPNDFVEEGDRVEITGIVSQRNNEYYLLPRGISDIKVLERRKLDTFEQKKSKKRNFGIKDYLFVGVPFLFLISAVIFRKKIREKFNKNPKLPDSLT